MSGPFRSTLAAGLGAWSLLGALPCHAGDPSAPNAAEAATETKDRGFWSDWLDMVSRTQAKQPHWVTPLVTGTPMLTQAFHYDILEERLPDGSHLNSYGGGKGLEFIPTSNTEIILAVPPYEQSTGAKPNSGLGDWPSILMKYRFLAANEQEGNYVLSGFLQFTGASGSQGFSSGTNILQPTLAFGKGWGRFDIQVNLAAQFPLSANDAARRFGKPILANIVAQYQLWEIVWPEFEANFTWWPDGDRQGDSQLFLTPGVIFGPFPIKDRMKFAMGAGYQFAVTPAPAYNGSFIFSLRLYF
jgi:hypothetical protein